MHQIKFYTKPGCHLCNEALELLLIVGEELNLELTIHEINILEDPKLYARYKHTIPVISIDPGMGGPTIQAPITALLLRQALSWAKG